MKNEELAMQLLRSIIRREFGTPISETYYDYHMDEFTTIVGRMHTNEEARIRETFRDMVKLNKQFAALDETEQDDVLFWMLVITFGNTFDLEYHSEGVLVNVRAES